ncbi:MAG: orotate phosphoribosyltransferase [Lachnospiraceae bacterium]|nr:orotate phosphoribosyltransferase [Lachnospiraceae bacterium]MCI9184739.1 orotate phosphoribosyltransferase [Lachnospiraceae bacterium]
MSMGEPTKIYAKDNHDVALKVTKGHFSSDRFHINYYIDMTSLKMRRKDAQQVAKAMVSRYVNRVNLSGNTPFVSGDMQQLIASMSTKTPIDTIICMDGCEVIGAYVASELSQIGVTTLNSHKTSYIITPEFDSTGQMVVRDNIRPMLKDKHVLVVLATAMSGRTISKSIRCIQSYGGLIEGISVIFSAVDEIDGYPVNSVFDTSDLPDFRLSDPSQCPDCKNGVKLDAIVNSYGYTVLD